MMLCWWCCCLSRAKKLTTSHFIHLLHLLYLILHPLHLFLSFMFFQIDQVRFFFTLFFHLLHPPHRSRLGVGVPLSIFLSIFPSTSAHPPLLPPPLSLDTQVVEQQAVWCWIITWCLELPGESGAFQGLFLFFQVFLFWFAGPGELVEPRELLHRERRGWAVGSTLLRGSERLPANGETSTPWICQSEPSKDVVTEYNVDFQSGTGVNTAVSQQGGCGFYYKPWTF